MKKSAFLIYAMAIFALLSCKEPMPQITVCKFSEGNVEITYQTIQNFKDSQALTSIEEQNYINIFGEDIMPMNIEAAYKKMEKQFNDEYSEYNEYQLTPCSCKIEQWCSFTRQNRVLCYRTFIHTYTGGAHGSYCIYYNNYDLKSGECYNLNYLFEGETGKAVRQIVCNKLREKDAEILGGWEAEELPPFSSAALLDNSVLLIYQPFEIASFAQGEVEIEISDEELLAVGAQLPL